MKILHIFAQTQWHSDAFITGNTESLILLRDAIDRALKNGSKIENIEVTVNDGEGYKLGIVVVNDLKKLEDLAVPYTDVIAEEHRDECWGPWDIHPHTIEEE